MEKQKIRLTQEKETLLVPLLSKALESEREHPILEDAKAVEILDGIDYDFHELHTPRQTLITLAMRAKKLDDIVREFLKQHEAPIVLHLGCGLDSRVLRVDPQKGAWYDLDYPDVIELRKTFYSETPRTHMIAASVTDLDWISKVQEGGPACVIAEGLLMYLHQEEIKQLFQALHERFAICEISFDAYSKLTARSANNHPSIKKTGASIHWGIDDPKEIETWNGDYHLLEEWFFTESEDIANLGAKDRLLFRVMGSFGAAKRAHRVLRFSL